VPWLAASSGFADSGDPAAGEKIFKAQCGICHAVAAGDNRIGPTLFGVVGRPAGSVRSFNYTADHKKLGITWDAATSRQITSQIIARWCRTHRWSTPVRRLSRKIRNAASVNIHDKA
jgi:mono/diheme cytochrome c family protein